MRAFLRRPATRLALLVLALLLGWLVVRLLREVLTPFVVAFALAYFLNPAANALERGLERALGGWPRLRQRVGPRALAVAALAAAVVLAAATIVVLVVPAGYHQVTEAAAKVPEYLARLRARADPLYQRLNLRYPEEVAAVRERAVATLREHFPQLLRPLTRGVGAAFSSVLNFVLAVLNLIIVPVFAFYLLYDMNRIREGVKELVPPRYRDYVWARGREVDRLLSAFVRGQLTVCLILGTFYAVGLTLCGVPMGLLVGLVIGLFNFVPFMSYVLGLPLGLVLSWLDDQSPARLLAVVVVFAVGQFVEGNFITPKIVGESLGLHAVVVMLAVLVGGTLFGFVGMFAAVPLTAALSVFWRDLREAYLKSAFYGPGPPAEGS
jgi:predicted PurR-regulated permease PerM